MIDARIFAHGASSITINVTKWSADKKTPAMYECTITHDSHQPSAVRAERDNAVAAERECVERFLEVFKTRKRVIHRAVLSERKSANERKRDDFEY